MVNRNFAVLNGAVEVVENGYVHFESTEFYGNMAVSVPVMEVYDAYRLSELRD